METTVYPRSGSDIDSGVTGPVPAALLAPGDAEAPADAVAPADALDPLAAVFGGGTVVLPPFGLLDEHPASTRHPASTAVPATPANRR